MFQHRRQRQRRGDPEHTTGRVVRAPQRAVAHEADTARKQPGKAWLRACYCGKQLPARVGQCKDSAIRVGDPDAAIRAFGHGGERANRLPAGFEALAACGQAQQLGAVADPQHATAVAQQPLCACGRVAPVGTGTVPARAIEPAQAAIDCGPEAPAAIALQLEHHAAGQVLAWCEVGEVAVGETVDPGTEIPDPRGVVRCERQRGHVVRCVRLAIGRRHTCEAVTIELEQAKTGRQPQRAVIGLRDIPDVGRCAALGAPGGVVKLQHAVACCGDPACPCRYAQQQPTARQRDPVRNAQA